MVHEFLISIGFKVNFQFDGVMVEYKRGRKGRASETITQYLPENRFESHGIMTGTSKTDFADALTHVGSSGEEYKLFKRKYTIGKIINLDK